MQIYDISAGKLREDGRLAMIYVPHGTTPYGTALSVRQLSAKEDVSIIRIHVRGGKTITFSRDTTMFPDAYSFEQIDEVLRTFEQQEHLKEANRKRREADMINMLLFKQNQETP